MINKIRSSIVVLIALSFSCSGPDPGSKVRSESEFFDDNNTNIEANDTSEELYNSNKVYGNDSLDHFKKIEVPDFMDYQSEVETYYRSYIGTAYDQIIYDKHFEKSKIKLDSLINAYEH